MGVPKTSDNIRIKFKMPNPGQEPPAPNEYLKNMDVLFIFKIKIESHNSEHWSTRDQ